MLLIQLKLRTATLEEFTSIFDHIGFTSRLLRVMTRMHSEVILHVRLQDTVGRKRGKGESNGSHLSYSKLNCAFGEEEGDKKTVGITGTWDK